MCSPTALQWFFGHLNGREGRYKDSFSKNKMLGDGGAGRGCVSMMRWMKKKKKMGGGRGRRGWRGRGVEVNHVWAFLSEMK